MSKQQRNYLTNMDGNRIYDPVTGRCKLGRSIKTNDWDNAENIEIWRKGWAEACNTEFERYGLEKRVTHMSYERQCIDREPTIHLGYKAKSLEKRGIFTDRGNINREIIERNRKRECRQRERSYDRDR
jgi:hypothetical protein